MDCSLVFWVPIGLSIRPPHLRSRDNGLRRCHCINIRNADEYRVRREVQNSEVASVEECVLFAVSRGIINDTGRQPAQLVAILEDPSNSYDAVVESE
jgi:hypothetical protein